MSVNVFADDHSDNSELVEKAKKITEEIANKNQIDEDEVPLNDPFAGNEGMSSSTVNPETGEERDEMSLFNFKLSGLISGKDESYITLTNTSGDVITLNLNQYLFLLFVQQLLRKYHKPIHLILIFQQWNF